MAPLVTTAKVAAALDETVGAGRNLIRRTKAICTAIGKLMSVLESPAGSASAVCAQILEAVGHLDDACKVCSLCFHCSLLPPRLVGEEGS